MNTPEQSSFFSKKSLFLLFFLISSVIIIVSYAYILNYRDSFQENTAKQLTTIADLKIREIVDWRNARLGDASLFYKNRNFSELALRYLNNPLDKQAKKFLLSWMAKVNSAYKYNRLEIYDSGFNFRIAYPEGIGREEHSFFKDDEKDLRSGKIVFKDFYRDANDKKIYMMLLVPLYNELSGGKFIGTLAMRIDPREHLYPYINQWPVPAESAEALLARREGDYAVYLNELRYIKDAPLELRVPLTATEFAVTKGALDQEGVAEALDYKGDRVIAAIKRIPDTPWFIVAHISKSEVTAPYIGRLWTVIFIALLMIASAGIVILLFRKHYDTQIYLKQLHDAGLLRQSESEKLLFSNALEQSLNEIYIFDSETLKFKTVNRGGRENTGYSVEELIRMTPADLMPDCTDDNLKQLMKPLFDNKAKIISFFSGFRRKDSTIYPVEVNLSIDDDHKLFVAAIIDLTRIKEMDRALDESMLLFKTVVETIPDLVWMKDAAGFYLICNPNFGRFMGAAAAHIIGKSDYDFLDSDIADSFREKEKRVRESGKTHVSEEWVTFADGGSRVMLETIRTPMADQNGEFTGLLGVARDITERKAAADMLNVRLELIKYADNHSVKEVLVRTLDEVERFTSSTISFFHFLNDDQKTLSLQAWSTGTREKFCKADGMGMHYNVSDAGVWVDCIKEKRTVVHNDYMSLPHRKGLPLGHAPVIREMVVPIIRENKIMGILGVGNKEADYIERDISIITYFADIAWDIIERRRNLEYLEKFNLELEKRVTERTSDLEKANKELDSFTYSISHDLRAPLRHVTGFIDMLRREVEEINNEKARHFMDVIDQSAKRMAELIDDLLSFSRLGRTSLSIKTVDMETLLDDVMSDFTGDIEKGNVTIIRHPLPEVTGDRSMLRVVLVNLISNAIKFSSKEPEPHVEIGCEKGGSGDDFYIRDNGAGFDMHYAERLFGVFQRLHNEKDFPGTGIGLAIVRSIIERHNGTIRAESEPGRGACFYFTIPVNEQRSGEPGGWYGKQ